MILEQLDKIQKEFIQLYREIESGEISLKPFTKGNTSLWSTSAMFDKRPLHIERARGNLTRERILDERPKDVKRISEGIYKDDEIMCVKFWKENELIGFANYHKIDKNSIQEKRVLIDDDEQELVGLSYYHKNEVGTIIKMVKAHRSGATLEEYEYVDKAISRLIIYKRNEFEVMDNADGITKSPIHKITYKTEYNRSGKLTAIIDEKGKNIYGKSKYKKRL